MPSQKTKYKTKIKKLYIANKKYPIKLSGGEV